MPSEPQYTHRRRRRGSDAMEKLNSMRVLERAGIAYAVHEFPAEHLSANEVATLVGVDPSRVFKTLVALAVDKPVLVMLAAADRLDLKALARSLGVKQAVMASQAEAEALTGLRVGGIGALALQHKRWRCILERSALDVSGGRILLSAGRRGVNVEVAVADVIELLQPLVVDLVQRNSGSSEA